MSAASDPSRWPSPSLRRLCVGLLGVVVLGGVAARHVAARDRAAKAAAVVATAVARGDRLLHVPHAPGPITLDGDTDDPGWLRPPGPARTGAWVLPDGRAARPYSEARVVWAGDYLFFALYASDEDIESHVTSPDHASGLDDAFVVTFSSVDADYAFEITPNAIVSDSVRRHGGPWDPQWTGDAHASREIDGTINEPSNTDEEWAIELAVPFESLGMRGERGETIGLSLHRCDTPKGTDRVCAGWGDGPQGEVRGRIVLE